MDPPPVQRVCPHCARISYDSGRHCPYCRRSFRRSVLPALAAMLTVFAVVVLGGMYAMFVVAGREVDEQLDREVQRDVREELDRRLPDPTATP